MLWPLKAVSISTVCKCLALSDMGTLGWGDNKKAELSLKNRADLQGLYVPDPSQENPSSPRKAGKDG